MKRLAIIILVVLCATVRVNAQSSPVWTATYSGVLQLPVGLLLDINQQTLTVWGRGVDDSCSLTAAAFVNLDTSGSILMDTVLDMSSCILELPLVATVSGSQETFYFATENNVITVADSCFLYGVDQNLNVVWSTFAGESMNSNLLYYERSIYYSSDDAAGVMTINKCDEGGNCGTLNTVSIPYFPSSPHTLLAENGLIFELGTRNNVLDTAFVCTVYDTSGNYFTTFSIDLDNQVGETMMHASIISNQLFHVSYRPSVSKTYVGSCGITGIESWRDTIFHSYRSACIDSTSSTGYVLCLNSSNLFSIYAYNLFTGSLIDSIIIDSVYSASRVKSGPAGGVYIMYGLLNSNKMIIEQYDVGLNLIWRGETQHPICSSSGTVIDFVLDSIGRIYCLSSYGSCQDNLVVDKFAPSLVGMTEHTHGDNISIQPCPADGEVRITLQHDAPSSYLRLYSGSGQLVQETFFTGNSVLVNTSSCESGIYFCEIITESGERHIQKLIIQHQ